MGGVGISHPYRSVYPLLQVTKLDVARYYDAVAPWMLPHVAGRPLTLLRCAGPIDPTADKGGCQMMRHGRVWGPDVLRRVKIQELRKIGEYLVADSEAALVALAQMDVLEVHTWNAPAETPYHHDRVVFDLDPGPDVPWKQVIDAAKLLRTMLAGLPLLSWVKTTGGKGLHVVVPIVPADSAQCLDFSRTVAAALIDYDRRRFTTASSKVGRERQILIDFLRNNRTNTSVAAFSLRARQRASVSVPIAWDELEARLSPDRFTISTVSKRLRRMADPWAGYWKTHQGLPAT